MHSLTRKVLLLAAVVLLGAVIVPVTHSQDGVHVSISDLKERVVKLEELPTQVAQINAKMDILEQDERERDGRSSTALITLSVGVGLMVLERVFAVVFGIKAKGKE